METMRMTKLVRLIHSMENEMLNDAQKVSNIKLAIDDGVITDKDGVELVLEYNLHI